MLADIPPSSAVLPSPSAAAASRSVLLCRFSSNLFLRSANTCNCRCSTPLNQYPKLPPIPAKKGYAQSPSLAKKGRISMPSCHNLTATPRCMTRQQLRGSVVLVESHAHRSRSRIGSCVPSWSRIRGKAGTRSRVDVGEIFGSRRNDQACGAGFEVAKDAHLMLSSCLYHRSHQGLQKLGIDRPQPP